MASVAMEFMRVSARFARAGRILLFTDMMSHTMPTAASIARARQSFLMYGFLRFLEDISPQFSILPLLLKFVLRHKKS